MKYYIPRFNLSKVESLVKRLSKKTNVVFSYDENDIKQEVLRTYDIYGKLRTYYYYTIGIELDVDYKVGDYTVVAELEHTGNGNIITRFGTDVELPTYYRDCDCNCEHCNTYRNRKNTFVLLDAKGNYKQVGKSCLNDFIGYNTLGIIDIANSLDVLLNPSRDYVDDEFMEYLEDSNRTPYRDTKQLANLCYQIISKNGYSKKTNDPFKDLDEYEYNKELEPKIDELLNVVNTSWYNDSEYCHNVKIILGMDALEPKYWRTLLSYINSAILYTQPSSSDYLGKVGDKVTINVVSSKVLYTKGGYAYNSPDTYVYRLLDNNGNAIIWSTTNELKDEPMTIKATIKGLKEFRNEKQTVITRGKLI